MLPQLPRVTDLRLSRSHPTEGVPFSEDHLFEVLSNKRRRLTLHYLKQRNDAVVMLRNLAEQVAAWECGKPIWGLTSDELKSVKNALHQFHLPKMDNYGVVEYDPHRRLVTLSEAANQLEVYVEIVPKHDIPWGPYYLLFTLLLSTSVVARWFELPPVADLPWAAFTIFFVVAITVSALVHSYYSYTRMRLGATTADMEVADSRE